MTVRWDINGPHLYGLQERHTKGVLLAEAVTGELGLQVAVAEMTTCHFEAGKRQERVVRAGSLLLTSRLERFMNGINTQLSIRSWTAVSLPSRPCKMSVRRKQPAMDNCLQRTVKPGRNAGRGVTV